jgi:hypothetical protein
MVLGGAVSIDIVPGYDFTFNELVTSEKLRRWIGGAHNTASLSAAEAGISASNTGDNLHTTATWATTATVGALTFNTSTGWVEITTDLGSVPVFGTQGGLFTKRLREGESSSAGFDRFYEGAEPNVLGCKPGHTPTLPAANYSAGEGYDNFGMNSGNVAAAIQGASDLSGHRAGKTFARYPSEHSYNPAGAWTVATYVTGASFVNSLYKLGGVQTLRFKLQYNAGVATGFTNTNDKTGLVAISMLAADPTNDLVFGGDPSNHLHVWYAPGTSSEVSLVDSNNVADEGKGIRDVAFDAARRFLYLNKDGGGSSGLSIFEVSTTGALTHLFHDNIPNQPRDVAFAAGSDYVHCSGKNVGLRTFKINNGTDASLSDINNPGHIGRIACPPALDNIIYGTNSNRGGDGTRYTFWHSSGSLSLVGTGTGSPLNTNCGGLIFDGNYIYECTDDDACVIMHSVDHTTGSVAYMGTFGSIGQPRLMDISGGILAVGHRGPNLRLFDTSNHSAVTQIAMDTDYGKVVAPVFMDSTRVFCGDVDDSKIGIFTWFAQSSSTAVSGMRGGVLGGVWEIEQSGVSLTQTRIVPFSQCFNYHGTKQLSVGFVQAILSKTDFRTGGYEF